MSYTSDSSQSLHVTRLGLLATAVTCLQMSLLQGMSWTSRACAQTPIEHRWSLIDLPSKAHPLWDQIKRGEPVAPLDWEALAQQVDQTSDYRSLKDLALLAAGLGWFREGLYYRASDAFSRIASRDHPLTEIHLFFWGESLFHLGKYSESADQFNELSRLRPGSLWVHRARFREVDLLSVLGDLEGALG